ncbi:MAG TPA: hypothetical protein VMR19_02975 [Candidatus Saccharimonadales bacterium]|nr:hypothetical protein [Candidatus Saccharimonadales bacterium]
MERQKMGLPDIMDVFADRLCAVASGIEAGTIIGLGLTSLNPDLYPIAQVVIKAWALPSLLTIGFGALHTGYTEKRLKREGKIK